jgi:hypothetical protein
MILFRLLMAPSNAVCDLFGLKDEHERGMVRMLVNGLLTITVAASVFFAACLIEARMS